MIKLLCIAVAVGITYAILTAVPGVPSFVIYGGMGVAGLLVGSVA